MRKRERDQDLKPTSIVEIDTSTSEDRFIFLPPISKGLWTEVIVKKKSKGRIDAESKST